jgi:hypothetical protein
MPSYGYIYLYICCRQYVYIYTAIGTNGNRQLPFVCCKRKTEKANFLWFSANGKQKAEVCFPWSANDERQSTFAVSANVPIHAKKCNRDKSEKVRDVWSTRDCTVYSRMRRKLRVWLYLGERMRLRPEGMKYIQKVRSERMGWGEVMRTRCET